MGVTLAANGSEALALLAKDRPDLVVSDVIMPDKSGYEVCACVRGQADSADLPVLLISGIVNDEVSRQAETCKADGVLKKPFQGTVSQRSLLDLLMKRPHESAPTPSHLRCRWYRSRRRFRPWSSLPILLSHSRGSDPTSEVEEVRPFELVTMERAGTRNGASQPRVVC